MNIDWDRQKQRHSEYFSFNPGFSDRVINALQSEKSTDPISLLPDFFSLWRAFKPVAIGFSLGCLLLFVLNHGQEPVLSSPNTTLDLETYLNQSTHQLLADAL